MTDQNKPPKTLKDHLLQMLRDPIWQAIGVVVAILSLIVAIIAIRDQPPPSPTQPALVASSPSDTPVPTATAVPPTDTPAPTLAATPTRVIDFGATQTEAILQRSADILELTNMAFLVESTHIMETWTAAAVPTATNTTTPTLSPTNTAIPLPTRTPQPTQLPTATYDVASQMTGNHPFPCEGQIVSSEVTILNVLHASPSDRSPFRQPVQPGITVIIQEISEGSRETWYKIADINNKFLGWISVDYLVQPISCPK